MIVIQASSKSYLGAPDKSIMEIGGEMVIQKLVAKLLQIPDVEIVIAAPTWDEGGCFDSLAGNLKSDRLRIYYGSPESPLERILGATKNLGNDEHICRIDGLNLFIRTEDIFKMLRKAQEEHLDILKFPDDFPPAFGCDIYNMGALRKLPKLNVDAIFNIHPKFYMFKNKDVFKCDFYTSYAIFDDGYLSTARETMRAIYDFKRLDVEENDPKYIVPSGNQISFHYELAFGKIGNDKTVLDLACGNGFGSRIMARNKTNKFLGVDIDNAIIEEAIALSTQNENVKFETVDILNNDFEPEFFDTILAFEIIEHIPPDLLLSNMHRILKKGGEIYISTPQNRMGHIPVCYEHMKEYSSSELANLVEEHFTIKEFSGIKQGNIIFENDRIGNNSFIIATKN